LFNNNKKIKYYEKYKIVLSIAIVAIGFTSCKMKKRRRQAQKKVDSYVVYVDSVSAISEAEAKMKTGEGIESSYQLRSEEAAVFYGS
jgi:hypothetical protein